MNQLIDFDILYILHNLDKQYSGLLENEIQVLLYLSSLIALYDSRPLAEWGYSFIGVDKLPYSSSITERLNTLSSSNYMTYSNSTNIYSLTENGENLYKLLEPFSYAKFRIKYLQATIDAISLSSLPLLVNVINNESMLNYTSSSNISKSEILGTGLLRTISYNDIRDLKEVTEQTNDLWIVSSLWIKYLNTIS